MGEAGVCGRLFGTDGVRGVAGRDLTARLAMDLSVAAAAVLGTGPDGTGPDGTGPDGTGPGAGRPVAVVGRDPRASGEFLEAAVVAGLASAGVDVLRLGVLPTPGVAYLAGALGADFGVVISASHNPARDNGIKFFGRGGVKLPDAVEDEIEARLAGAGAGASTGAGAGPSSRASAGSPTRPRPMSCTWSICCPPCPARRAGPCPGCGWWPTARMGRPTGSPPRRCAARARR